MVHPHQSRTRHRLHSRQNSDSCSRGGGPPARPSERPPHTRMVSRCDQSSNDPATRNVFCGPFRQGNILEWKESRAGKFTTHANTSHLRRGSECERGRIASRHGRRNGPRCTFLRIRTYAKSTQGAGIRTDPITEERAGVRCVPRTRR